MNDMSQVISGCEVCVDKDHSIVVGMGASQEVVAQFKRYQRIDVQKHRVGDASNPYDWYIIAGVPGHKFGRSVIQQFLSVEDMQRLRDMPPHHTSKS
jgi:hypothetical protein